MKGMETVKKIAGWLLAIGGLNWGLIGIANFNLVTTIFGSAANVVYILVGASGVYYLTTMLKKR